MVRAKEEIVLTVISYLSSKSHYSEYLTIVIVIIIIKNYQTVLAITNLQEAALKMKDG